MSWGAAAAVGAGIVIPALANILSGKSTNETNIKLQEMSNQANQANAREQMGFQRWMSDTAFRRQMFDMKQAGINPLLMTPGGASTPTGAAGQSSAAKTENFVGPALAQAASSAIDYKMRSEKQDADVGYTRAQTAKTLVDAEVARKGIPSSEMKNQLYDAVKPLVKKATEKIKSSAKDYMGDKPEKRPISKKYLEDFKKRSLARPGGLR